MGEIRLYHYLYLMNYLVSIWKYKCPRCRKGDLFTKPFDISNPLNMNEKCKYCGQLTQPEPGYYFGAMFISYIWTGFLCLGIVGFCMLVLGWTVNQSFILLLILAALSFFFITRISRSIYIHLDVRYNPELAAKVGEPEQQD